MINLGETEFYIKARNLSLIDFEDYSTKLFDSWDEYIEANLIIPDYSISLAIEEGSINGWGKVAATLGAIYLGVGNYGSFISGIDTIEKQIEAVSKALPKRAVEPLSNHQEMSSKRRSGDLAKLQRLFRKVQSGEISADEAMAEAEKLLEGESLSSPEFMNKLNNSLQTALKFPQQIPIEYEGIEDNLMKMEKVNVKSRQLPKKPEIPDQHYRVEIWRESRNEKKKVKVTKS